MFDFEFMFRRAVAACGAPRPIIATPYDVPGRVCLDLIAEGLVDSFVADSAACAVTAPWCGGWWVDREAGTLHLRHRKATTLVVAGVERGRKIHGSALLEAHLKGVERIVLCDPNGNLIEEASVSRAIEARLNAGLESRDFLAPTYEDAFEAMFQLLGNALALPSYAYSDSAVALCLGSLGPGGAERQAAYTAAGLMTADVAERVTIICNHVAPPADFFRPYVEQRGVRVFGVEPVPPELDIPQVAAARAELAGRFGVLGFDSIFLEILRYASALRKLRPALLHSWMDYCNALCGAAAQLVGVPAVVLSCRSVAPSNFRIFQPYMRPAYQSLLRRRRVVVLNNSRAGANDYADWLGISPGSIKVVHNGYEFPDMDWEAARARVRAQHGIQPEEVVVGSILRFSEEKRPHLLIDTAAHLHQRFPRLRFLFFGGGVMHEEIQSLVRARGLGSTILVPGLTNDTWGALASMDLFLLTSRMEGLPNVLIEAQAAGVPVVCTGVGGMSETFLESTTGVTADAATPEALAAAATWILQDEDRRRQMRARAVSHARSSFGMESMLRGTLDAYAEAHAVRNETPERLLA